MNTFRHALTVLACTAGFGLAASSAQAQATIDHTKALAGNVTPGDTAGYPVTISRSGHYVLKGNLVVPAGTAGILIAASNVTIDLNGFTVAGNVACAYTSSPSKKVTCTGQTGGGLSMSGITNQYGTTGAVVRNGFVKGFSGDGIYLTGSGAVIEGVVSSENYMTGLEVAAGGRIVGSSAFVNRGFGAQGRECILERSVLQRNGMGGGELPFCLVSESMVVENPTGVAGAAVRAVRFYQNNSDDYYASMGGNLKSNNVAF